MTDQQPYSVQQQPPPSASEPAATECEFDPDHVYSQCATPEWHRPALSMGATAGGDRLEQIRQRLELAEHLPEQFASGNSAADRWREDVTTLLAERDQLRAQVEAMRGVVEEARTAQICQRVTPELETALAALDQAQPQEEQTLRQ